MYEASDDMASNLPKKYLVASPDPINTKLPLSIWEARATT
mgnify:CR=1 FL=1